MSSTQLNQKLKLKVDGLLIGFTSLWRSHFLPHAIYFVSNARGRWNERIITTMHKTYCFPCQSCQSYHICLTLKKHAYVKLTLVLSNSWKCNSKQVSRFAYSNVHMTDGRSRGSFSSCSSKDNRRCDVSCRILSHINFTNLATSTNFTGQKSTWQSISGPKWIAYHK